MDGGDSFLPSATMGFEESGFLDEAASGLLPDRAPSGRAPAPQIDMPQRVGHPPGIKAPVRLSSANRDDQILEVFGSRSEAPEGAESARRQGAPSLRAKTQNNNTALRKLRDLEILAKTCRRAGRLEKEAHALYCRGVLFDNLERWKKAIECYEGFLRLCHKLNDLDSASVAYNCCGVAYFNLALGGAEAANRAVGLREEGSRAPSDPFDADAGMEETKEALCTAAAPAATCAEPLETAIAYNVKHFESSDDPGRFVALCNIGLCHSRLGDHSKALDYHQQALKLAIDLSSPHGQSLAVGNLALASAELGDWDTARACMDKHLHLVKDLENVEAQSLACHQLGQMASRYGNYQDALKYFEEAHRIATVAGERGMLKLIACNIGVATGNMRMEEYMRKLAARTGK